ncbi:MAG: protein-tyrosine phosphatase [Pseudonocardiales bacterium]|nr:protein-tyrosine phosphatase [Pseudonocardiales bacterium]
MVAETEPAWIELEGGANARDIGGLPTIDGGRTRAGVLIRSANLQHLTKADLARFAELGVRRVVDLRTDVEVEAEGAGPMMRQPDVTVHHLSLFPDSSEVHDEVAARGGESADDGGASFPPERAASADDSGASLPPERAASASKSNASLLLPWHGRGKPPVVTGIADADLYLTYLDRRPDSVVASLGAIAEPDGATVVHCAAGKDRTGVVVAIALSLVGVERSAISADYAATEAQISAIIALLRRTATYQRDVADPASVPPPRAEVIDAVLDALTGRPGGISGWLSEHGWTSDDTDRLRARLLV